MSITRIIYVIIMALEVQMYCVYPNVTNAAYDGTASVNFFISSIFLNSQLVSVQSPFYHVPSLQTLHGLAS